MTSVSYVVGWQTISKVAAAQLTSRKDYGFPITHLRQKLTSEQQQHISNSKQESKLNAYGQVL